LGRAAEAQARARLLRAAEDVFAERGVARSDIEEIVRRAGVTRESFHDHFDCKERALDEIVQSWIAACTSLFADPSEYPEVSDDPGAILDFVIERDLEMYGFFWRTRVTLKLLHAHRNEYVSLIDGFKSNMHRRTRAWLEAWRQDGLLRADLDVRLAATLMGGAYQELTMQVIGQESEPPLRAWLEFAQETFMRAFGMPELIVAVERRRQRTTSQVRAAYVLDPDR
jgi:AcrR family transcriptional regulator